MCRNTDVVHLICHFQSEGGVLLAACFFILTLFLDNSLERKDAKRRHVARWAVRTHKTKRGSERKKQAEKAERKEELSSCLVS